MSAPVRQSITVSGFDGSRLSATLLMREGVIARAGHGERPPVVVLPGHLRAARMLEPFAEASLGQSGGAERVLLVDYRGRGASQHRKKTTLYTPRAEAQDVVSLLDALNWHHADVIGSARGGLVAMCLTEARPALVRRLVLNDIGPELDGVGLARLKMAAARHRSPGNWDEAVETLRKQIAEHYPAVDAAELERLVRLDYDDVDGAPASRVHPSVFEHFAAIDPDERYPTLWPEFRALRAKPVMLLRAENGDVLNDDIVARMHRAHPDLVEQRVAGQGHAPLLHVGDWPARIDAFLA